MANRIGTRIGTARVFGKALALGAVLALTACGGGGGGASEGGGGDTTSGAETTYAGPITSTDTAHGETRFNAVCASCHNNGAPQLANIAWTAEHMRQQIREGSAQMPAIRDARLSAPDMEAVLAYLQTIGAVGADAPAEPATAAQ
jgi:mono/diheme cytochrome c family protein